MEILLHLGAHRSASTTFQSYLWSNRSQLAQAGLTCWTPKRTRDGLMRGMLRHPALITVHDEQQALRSIGRIRIEIDRLTRAQQRWLLISEENMIGSMANNKLDARLYPLLRERLMRFAPAFEGHKMRIGLCIRSYEDFWSSSLSHLLTQGHARPDEDLLDFLTTQPRRWRSVIRDIAEVFPKAEIVVWPFERMANQPKRQLNAMWNEAPNTPAASDTWHNRSASLPQLNEIMRLRGERSLSDAPLEISARWMPFNEDQRSVLRAEYRRDIAWLKAGAEGLARYVEGWPTSPHPTVSGHISPEKIHNNEGKRPSLSPDRAIMNRTLNTNGAPFGGQHDGIKKGLGRTGAT